MDTTERMTGKSEGDSDFGLKALLLMIQIYAESKGEEATAGLIRTILETYRK